MYCYCRHLFWSALYEGRNPSSELNTEFSDGKKHCVEWFKQYSVQQTLLYAVPFSIISVNWISKTILRLMAHFEGYQSRPEEV